MQRPEKISLSAIDIWFDDKLMKVNSVKPNNDLASNDWILLSEKFNSVKFSKFSHISSITLLVTFVSKCFLSCLHFISSLVNLSGL